MCVFFFFDSCRAAERIKNRQFNQSKLETITHFHRFSLISEASCSILERKKVCISGWNNYKLFTQELIVHESRKNNRFFVLALKKNLLIDVR